MIIGINPCACVKNRENISNMFLQGHLLKIYVLNANLVSGKYQSNQQGDSIAVNIS
jgi:hypothetical protein